MEAGRGRTMLSVSERYIRELNADADDRTHEPERQDRYPLHGRPRIPGLGIPHPGKRDL